MPTAQKSKEKQESDVIGTLMSLLVAFTLAMAFRGFVLEGFVIPTGSMGPTLMGAHIRLFSPVTGYEYPADASSAIAFAQQPMQRNGGSPALAVLDPMISQRQPIAIRPSAQLASETRAGDRVLVLKPLFLVSEPHRWDVVVFKNPTDPVGDTQNYIKRLVGLPNESFLLLDGDVFTGPLGAKTDELRITRKPEFVQRAVWQPIYHSDFQPVVPLAALETGMHARWEGPPWRADESSAARWTLAPERAWQCTGAGKSSLEWNPRAWPIDDWNAYNAFRAAAEAAGMGGFQTMADPNRRAERYFPVSDLRLSATVECADLEHFATTFALSARKCNFRFELSGAERKVRVSRTLAETGNVLDTAEFAFQPRNDGILSFEFWHVDQQLWAFVNGTLVGVLPYEYATLSERVMASNNGRTVADYIRNHTDSRAPTPPTLSWSFDSAAPFSLHRVGVDRDLYYRPVRFDPNNQVAVNGDPLEGPGFATDFEHPAQVGADQFVMLGDNSSASRDARLWGRAHQLVLQTHGDASPGIVPRDMIVGRAWCVYFPAPVSMSPGGAAFIPDFGRLRLIR